MTTHLDWLCNEVLSLIEIDEARLLNWGFVETRTNLTASLPDLLLRLPSQAAEAWEAAQAQGITPTHVLTNLVDRKLIFPTRGMYRTRFAETIRLLYLLRQRFSYKDWHTAPRLVSDLKIQLQRRRYPQRNVDVESLLRDLGELRLSSLHTRAIKALLSAGDGSYLQLAQFQKDAILQQLRNLQERGDRALVIGAGTGAGKTKAFYIPAMAEIAATLTPGRWVRALAIYPRVELLKDQLAEAYAEARKLDSLLQTHDKRPITVGAYYADTPRSAEQLLTPSYKGWALSGSGQGWICPYLRCPNSGCRAGELIWARADVEQEATANQQNEYGRWTRLRCESCGWETKAGHLVLTRKQMVHEAPDILFTTTEMLNRRLSRAREHSLFGVYTQNPPRFLLLDEIHTYEGLTGAQVSYLIRRWRHARGRYAQSNLCITGLSATLAQAESFFAKLTGVPLYHVSYIRPRESELIDEGLEYNVVIKGDPVSGTSLLSTSVQTAMLLGRILDPPPGRDASLSISRGAYGQKIFAFTDKLDVINRWYHIEQDAEIRQTLSQFRVPRDGQGRALPVGSPERAGWNQAGQDWVITEYIGHRLQAPLHLDLTSSQSRGVSSTAQLVIATSTLEVGFNDPMVGGVIQHKAPRSLASFLQRKGRAGRTRTMRPWMVVVASAYGRDRWAFQHSESLFDPILPAIDLPTENYYVRKIQAAYALMDWLTLTLRQQDRSIDLWELLISDERHRTDYYQRQRRLVVDVLTNVLSGSRLGELTAYLQHALGIEDDTLIQTLLWDEPRALLLDVIPTMLRQIETSWQRVIKGEPHAWGDNIAESPLPEFVPPNLFSDLSVPELTLHIPDTRPVAQGQGKARNRGRRPALSTVDHGHTEATPGVPPDAAVQRMREDQHMPLAQGLVEFAPGHVSKRFARPHLLQEAHWLELPEEAQLTRSVLPLQYLKIDRDDLPKMLTLDDTEYRIYRPRAYTLSLVPDHVKSTSSAQLIWRSHFLPRSQGFRSAVEQTVMHDEDITNLTLAPRSKWSKLIHTMRAYTQSNGSWIEVTRLATAVHTDTRLEGGREIRRMLAFEDDGQPAALGFSIDADGLEFLFEPLDTQAMLASPVWAELYQHLGPEYFLYRLQNDVRLQEAGLSGFDIGWLWQLELSMLVATAVAERCSLQAAAEVVQSMRRRLADRTMQVIFQSQDLEDDDVTGRLHRRLLDHIERPEVQDALRDQVAVLWNLNHTDLPAWLEGCYASSLGATLFTAVTQLLPDISSDDLLFDVVDGRVWITEATAGGVGLISKIANAIALRPRELELQLLDTLESCDREQLALQLRAVASLVEQRNEPLLAAFAQARELLDLPKQVATRELLAQTLEQHGLTGGRETIVALNAKFLRPNSGPDSDALIASLARHWEQKEQRIGLAIDLRVMAVAARRIPEIDEQVQAVLYRIGGTDARVDETQIFNLLQSMLWLRCTDSCPDCIETWQPYQDLVRPSRALLRALLEPDARPVIYGVGGWQAEVERRLTEEYYVQLSCEQENLLDCKQVLLSLLVTPVEVGFQLLYPMVERIARSGHLWKIDLSLRELISG